MARSEMDPFAFADFPVCLCALGELDSFSQEEAKRPPKDVI
jgi:hypothetical protein